MRIESSGKMLIQQVTFNLDSISGQLSWLLENCPIAAGWQQLRQFHESLMTVAIA